MKCFFSPKTVNDMTWQNDIVSFARSASAPASQGKKCQHFINSCAALLTPPLNPVRLLKREKKYIDKNLSLILRSGTCYKYN